MNTLGKTHAANIATVVQHWETRAKKFGVDLPAVNISSTDDIDYSHVRFWTELAKRGNLYLPDSVQICRGQTSDDTRPNKDLYELPSPVHPEMSDNVAHWNSIVRHGVIPRWSKDKPRQQHTRRPNHGSIDGHGHSIRRHLRKGQLEGRYLIVDVQLLDQWPEFFISPLAVVDKPGAVKVDIRPINDYSFPPDASVNDYTDRSDHPPISYNPPKAIARRIHQLKQLNPATSVLLVLGDVAGAFRHVPIHADAVHMFSFLYEDVLVIDLSCGFGWCGSPSYYSLAGNLINYSYEFGNRLTQQLTGNVWCDDHTCVELDEGSRCFDANIALRRAMAKILGPTAINELKFTRWSTVVKALGLLWNTETGCVSIPAEKTTKAVDRVNSLLEARSITKTAVLKTIGSLRHIASCSRPARAFFQRLQFSANSMPRFGQRKLSSEAREDLHWFLAVLKNPNKFNSIPVAQFADLSEPSVHVYMDASGEGLCSLEPTLQRYIRQRFSEEESHSLSINVRELRSAVLAVLHWGPRWHKPSSTVPIHVQFHIDNTSAVTWANKRASKHPTAQLYNRLLSLAEFQYNLVCTASHIPGKLNIMADAGSRAWSSHDHVSTLWTNLSASWLQDRVEPPFDDLSGLWDRCSSNTPWQALPVPSISRIGTNGADSHEKWGGHDG